VLAAGGVFALVVGALVLREGEVATLTTLDAAGRPLESELWIVEPEGALFLRAGSEHEHWLEHVRAAPEAVLERAGRERRVRAVPSDDPQVRAAVNRAMAEKYGLLDRLWGALRDPSRSVPVRLDPIDGAPAGGGGGP
jgi:hypothetical protein